MKAMIKISAVPAIKSCSWAIWRLHRLKVCLFGCLLGHLDTLKRPLHSTRNHNNISMHSHRQLPLTLKPSS